MLLVLEDSFRFLLCSVKPSEKLLPHFPSTSQGCASQAFITTMRGNHPETLSRKKPFIPQVAFVIVTSQIMKMTPKKMLVIHSFGALLLPHAKHRLWED